VQAERPTAESPQRPQDDRGDRGVSEHWLDKVDERVTRSEREGGSQRHDHERQQQELGSGLPADETPAHRARHPGEDDDCDSHVEENQSRPEECRGATTAIIRLAPMRVAISVSLGGCRLGGAETTTASEGP
jgi:hypothetical protein